MGPISLFQDHPLSLISFTSAKARTFWFSFGFDYCKPWQVGPISLF
jgi:hypothetical protein